jgi:cytochrome bd-type quinol oxidase subunit 2
MGLFNSSSNFASVVQDLISLINLLIGVMAPLALVLFFAGLVRYVYKSDDEHERARGKETITWSLIALFVLFSIWGILALMNEAFFGGTVGEPLNIAPSYGSFNTPTPGNSGGSGGNLGGMY